jgi:hypothetical protein
LNAICDSLPLPAKLSFKIRLRIERSSDLVLIRRFSKPSIELAARLGYLAAWVREHGGWKFIAYQPTPIIKD